MDVLVSGSFETGQLILETDLVFPLPPRYSMLVFNILLAGMHV